jgi:NAD(P)-dependent dehydrogenase (short-subunit alcohol dehydrogenase family)
MTLDGKVVAVIGASSGIGEGIARAVAERNPKGIVLAARREEKLKQLSSELNVETLIVPTDVTNYESIRNLVEKTLERYGHLDVMINSAGVIQKEEQIENLDEEIINRIIDTNLRQVIFVGKNIASHFKERGRGVYVVISSQAGKYAFAGETAYNASKAGADHMIRALSEEWKPHREKGEDLYAFSIGPGFINTDEAKRQFPDVPQEVWDKSPSPLEFGRTVVEYIIDPQKKYSEGEAVHYIETAKY